MLDNKRTANLSEGLRHIGSNAQHIPASGSPVYDKERIREEYSRERDMSKVKVIPAKPAPSLFGNHKKQRVAVYCRVSTDGIQQTTSFELQRNYYLKYVQRKPEWTLVAMYSDEGITATNTKHRKGLQQMIADAVAGKFDVIIVKNLSRLSRNLLDCTNIIKKLRNLPNPVGIYFESENMYTLGENMDFMLQMLSLVAQEESHKKSEAMNASYKQRFESGQYMKPDLLGYRKSGVNQIEVDPEEAKTVQLIFMMFLSGCKTAFIAEVLEMLERKTHTHVYRDGRVKEGVVKWTASSVRSVLLNERRCGDVLAQKTYTPDYLDHRSVRNVFNLPQYYAEDQHEAIVSQEDFFLTQRILGAGRLDWREELPSMSIYQDGLLEGFVSTVPNWNGFDTEDYNRANLRASGVEEQQLDEIEQRIAAEIEEEHSRMQEMLKQSAALGDDFALFSEESEEDKPTVEARPRESYAKRVQELGNQLSAVRRKQDVSAYDLSSCEIVRPEFFSLREKLYFTMDKRSIMFNKNCWNEMMKAGAALNHMEIVYNPMEKLLIIMPSKEESELTVRWSKKKNNGSVCMRKCGCTGTSRAVYENMGWNEDFKYRVLGSYMKFDDRHMLVFYLEDASAIVPIRKAGEIPEEEQSIVSKEELPEEVPNLTAEDYRRELEGSKNTSKSRAIYFDSGNSKMPEELHVDDLGHEKYKPERIRRLIEQGITPVEGWLYLKGMAEMRHNGFTIYPESWSEGFGPSIYTREYNKIQNRVDQASSKLGDKCAYGWTVGIVLPSQETVDQTIQMLMDEMTA